ncbi:MAG: RagB/SusD family nutrient uptake outer membrane protein [Paludibacter sp.]|nr:RagB/SusD family nutrient uptake outer membrane protein [Paludibacter sp.]
MKNIILKNIIGIALIALFASACSSDMLEEHPRAMYTPEYFKTPQGVQMGLTSLYVHTRYIFGQYFYAAQETGTDEYTWANSGQEDNFQALDFDPNVTRRCTPSSSRADVLWNAVFSNINTASGIIENAANAGINESMISEARFWRAWDYFMLVQTFGGVPLDLGAGELKFNSSAATTSVRNTVPEVYTKAIFPDLKMAIDNLPDNGRLTGTITKTAARLYLAKAYLTYAWWLENPNNIPTYPNCQRTDPDGQTAAWYFQQAYNVALQGIDNPGPFGLMDYYYDVNLGSKDRNKEIVLYSDHCQDEYYNQASLSWSNGSAPENYAVWYVTCQTENIRSSGDGGATYGIQSVTRAATQWGGRPWTRMAPPIGVFTNTFADKTNDSRYDGTFAAVYPANMAQAGKTNPVVNANGMTVYSGQPILTFLDEDNPNVVYPSGDGSSGVGAGTLPGRADWVINPSGINRRYYPGLWKLGTYRTDNGTGVGQPNGAITRPWNIAKFSELYFIAAEAAVKGATGNKSARDLINVIRARAGKWRYSNNGQYSMPNGDGTLDPASNDHNEAMKAATPATIDINYILAERSREYFGEGYRWYDLVRTQKWEEIAGQISICATGSHTPVTVTRNMTKQNYLRPIPQGQFDRMTMTDEEKAAYQNPGY